MKRPQSAKRARSPKPSARGKRPGLPYYNQTLNFTCGPSSLLMAMKALDQAVEFNRSHELQLWREANTIFMGGGHGGCGALGLAIAASRRGFKPAVWVNHRGTLLADRARLDERRKVMSILQDRDLEEAQKRRIPVTYGRLSIADLELALDRGRIPIVLITCRYIHGDSTPHWIVVSDVDDESVYVNDPWISRDKGKTRRHMTRLKVPRATFEKMTRYGKAKERATVLIGR
jgi:hypothetical protein